MKNKSRKTYELPELLAPAGDIEALKAAVENGADAVYLGGKLFNARQNAGNFDNIELEKAIDFSHVRGVKVYLTMNTLLLDKEIKEALEFVGQAYDMGIDAIIIQDIGFASLIRHEYPQINLHASTQMTIYNSEGVNYLNKMGFKRVVLARELSLEEISYITHNCSTEVEVFVHGALCISYSGQCLMSSMLGGRSGNRGKCAQPCRLPYSLISDNQSIINSQYNEHDKTHILSPKDICTITDLDKIIDSGIKSLKIEGRMKTPEYVATVVKTYRKYLDKAYEKAKFDDDNTKEDMKNLHQVFNRGGFSNGYLYGKNGINMMSLEKPKNWGVYIGDVIFSDNNSRTVTIKLHDSLSIGDGIEVWIKDDGESPGTIVSELTKNKIAIKEAKASEIVTVGRLKGKISKGDKVYKTSDKKLMETARETWRRGFLKRVEVMGEVYIKSGKVSTLIVKDQEENTVKIIGQYVVEKALNAELTEDRIREQINKTGNTPFIFGELQVHLDEGITLPIKELNNLRRKALEELESKRIMKYKHYSQSGLFKNPELSQEKPKTQGNKTSTVIPKISLLYYKLDSVKQADRLVRLSLLDNFNKSSISRIYLPFHFFLKTLVKEECKIEMAGLIDLLRQNDIEIFVYLPSITRGNYDLLIKSNIQRLVDLGIDGFLIGNLGALEYMSQFPQVKIACDHSFNIFNSETVEHLSNAGVDCLTLSYELTLNQIKNISNTLLKKGVIVDKEIAIYGRAPLMTSEYCPIGALSNDGNFEGGTCNNRNCTKGNYWLEDRIKETFPIYPDTIDCRTTILNSKTLFLADNLNKIISSGADIFRINIWDESIYEVKDLISMHKNMLEGDFDDKLKKYEGLIKTIKNKGFTRGHYFRGV